VSPAPDLPDPLPLEALRAMARSVQTGPEPRGLRPVPWRWAYQAVIGLGVLATLGLTSVMPAWSILLAVAVIVITVADAMCRDYRRAQREKESLR
jgi:Flp pilus assembly protein TadB